MKTLLCCGLFLGALTSLAAANDPTVMRVVGSSDLQLAIVDSGKPSPARDAMHKAFAASLGKALSATGGNPAVVQMKCLNADQAAFGLTSGRFHAVLAIGKTLPRSLALSATARLKATLGADKDQRVAYLIFSIDDSGLEKLLNDSFPVAIGDPHFLDALDGGIEPDAAPEKSQTLASLSR
jgi:hypothetical protein